MLYDPSLNAFFNALIREWDLARYHRRGQDEASSASSQPDVFEIRGPDDTALVIPCQFRTQTGRHCLTGPLQLNRHGQTENISFEQAVEWCLTLDALQREASPQALEALKARVIASKQNLDAAQQARTGALEHLFRESLSFIEAEQALISGHSIHPCPKDRGNMTLEQAQRYAPEYGDYFPLIWYSVAEAHLFNREAEGVTADQGIKALLDTEPAADDLRAATPSSHRLMPCHPFQHYHWQRTPALRSLQASGALRCIGPGASHWRATSSLRAIYCEAAPWMLKFSLSVWLTNSIRHLQPEEVVRGAELCRVLNSGPVRQWLTSRPNFEVLREPVATGIQGSDGQPLPETLVTWRENPLQGTNAANTEMLATLLQDDPRNGESRLSQRLHAAQMTPDQTQQWFLRYLNVAVAPLLEAQSLFGILFGAHQQNLVLQLHGIWPQRLFFRDCQGTGFTSLATHRLGDELSHLANDSANLLPDDLGIRLFCYYLFINATFNVIASLAAGGLVHEADLIQTLRDWLSARLDEQPPDDRAIRYLLESHSLYAKGNFLCTLRALNETTLDDVFSIYHPFTNPLHRESHCHVA
ncbi:IucA/IucC family protein [Salicola sp. Rm-C-2C1-2]|uniref:IucA/IucC family protein n=1 Tax=Salicola sp. Rm-C-2C1-2 TaxID=3141321 RepID=UPI0032E50E1F